MLCNLLSTIFQWKGDTMGCGRFRVIGFLNHTKVVESVLVKRLCVIITVNEIQF